MFLYFNIRNTVTLQFDIDLHAIRITGKFEEVDRHKNLFKLKSNEKLCQPMLKLIGQYRCRSIGVQRRFLFDANMLIKCRFEVAAFTVANERDSSRGKQRKAAVL